MKKVNIHIPEPCHENWDEMTEKEKGRHCSSCNKVVVDFRGVPDDQLQQQFESFVRERKDVCGRFRNDQLTQSKPVRYYEFNYRNLKLNTWQTFLFAFIFAFFLGGFSSCKVGTGTMGVPIWDRDQLLNVDRHLNAFDHHCNDNDCCQGIPIAAHDTLRLDTAKHVLTHKMFFMSDSASLTDQTKLALKELADTLIKYNDYSIEIIGHTDSTGTEAHNKKLSIDRANAVADYLRARGLKVEIVRGVGYQYPIGDNSTENGRALNRRVEVVVTRKKQPPKR